MKNKIVTLVAIALVAAFFGAINVWGKKEIVKNDFLVFPKGSTYTNEWKKVDSLISKGLNKSALMVVNAIYEKAKTDRNSPQVVKSIIHRMKLEQYMEEYSLEKALVKLNEEIKTAKYPVKPMLQSMLAENYWTCLLYTSPSPRDRTRSRMPSSA